MIRRAVLALVRLQDDPGARVAQCGGRGLADGDRPAQRPVDFTGPRIENDAFVSFDGARLGYSEWLPDGEPWAVIVAVHGMNEYAERFSLAGTYWAKQGVATLAYDQRGYGRSPGRRIWAGQELLKEDLRTMVGLARARYPKATLVVAGFSMGGAVSMVTFGADDAPAVDRLVLLSPAVWGWNTQPLPNRTALWIVGKTGRTVDFDPPKLLGNFFKPTDNVPEMMRMREDPLMTWGTRTDTLYGVVDLMQAASASAGTIKVPTLYLYGYQDIVIPKNAAFQAAGRLKPTDKTGYYLDGHHLLLVDQQRERVFEDVLGFIRDPSAPLVSGVVPMPKE